MFIGVDPKLISEYLWKKLESELRGTFDLISFPPNLVDLLWLQNVTEQRKDERAFILDTTVAGIDDLTLI